MAFLKAWVTNIVVTMIFVIFIEILMPNSSMRRYINFVLGLLVMLVILNPLINVVGGDFDFGGKVLEVSSAIDTTDIQLKLDSIRKGQQEGIISEYKEKLACQIERQITGMGLSTVVSVDVEIDDRYEAETFGTIKGIRVITTDMGGLHEKQSVREVEIKVDIDGKEQSMDDDCKQDQQLNKEISEYLAHTYNLPTENIEVVVQEAHR